MKELLVTLQSSDIRNNPDFYQIKPDGSLVQEAISKLESTVYGQERACREVGRAVVRALAGMSSPNRPEFSLLLCGETGVGKTEMSKGIAKLQHEKDWEKHLKIIDCSNFKERHEIARLTGSPPGYVGFGMPGVLTKEFLADRNVVVFDEVEKGHIALHQLLLSILDRGKLQVTSGRGHEELNFAMSTIVLTTNVGAEELHNVKKGRRCGFDTHTCDNQDVYEIGLRSVKEHFRHMPELLGRLDAMVVMDSLTLPVMRRIMDKFMDEMNDDQQYGRNFLALTGECKDWVIGKTNIEYGARDLRKSLEKLVIAPAAEVKLELKSGVPFIADLDDEGQLIFWTSKTMRDETPEVTSKKKVYVIPIQCPKDSPNGNGSDGDDPTVIIKGPLL